MFFHHKGLQFEAKPDAPDAVYAKHLQEVLGGAYGEMTVATQYLFQGWSCRMPGKYKDLLMDIGTEELAHVEMLSVMIARLLEDAPADAQEEAAKKDPVLAAAMGGSNPQHVIVSGQGPRPQDSTGFPWSGRYVTASGNLMADFHANVTAEAQGRLQVVRLFNLTDDSGVKHLLRFLIARDTMHQNQWLAAIENLKEDGLEEMPVPSALPQSEENQDVNYEFQSYSAGSESRLGRWASGPTPDGRGEFSYAEITEPNTPEPLMGRPNPDFYSTFSMGGMIKGGVDKLKS